MKKFFKFALMAIAMMAVSAAMVSCGDDKEDVPTPTPTSKSHDVTFYTVLNDSELPYYDFSYNLSYNGQSKTIKLSEMTDVTSDATIAKVADNPKEVVAISGVKMPSYKIYAYNCGNFAAGTKVQLTGSTATVKAGHSTTGEFDALMGVSFGIISDGIFLQQSAQAHFFMNIEANNEEAVQALAGSLSGMTLDYVVPTISN